MVLRSPPTCWRTSSPWGPPSSSRSGRQEVYSLVAGRETLCSVTWQYETRVSRTTTWPQPNTPKPQRPLPPSLPRNSEAPISRFGGVLLDNRHAVSRIGRRGEAVPTRGSHLCRDGGAALFTVASFRSVQIASGFVISDLLDAERWEPRMRHDATTGGLNCLYDVALQTLKSDRRSLTSFGVAATCFDLAPLPWSGFLSVGLMWSPSPPRESPPRHISRVAGHQAN